MKTRHEITIDADCQTVWRLYTDTSRRRHWQPGLVHIQHVTGTPCTRGAVAELVYMHKGKQILMTETITESRSPDFITGTYDGPYASTHVVQHFVAAENGATRWTGFCVYHFKGIMKLLSLLMARSIRERTNADMQRFKLYVETEAATS